MRFIGVDTPESTTQVEEYGKAASAYTSKWLHPGRQVFLEKDVEERDEYGRLLLAYYSVDKADIGNRRRGRSYMFNARQLALDGYAQQLTIPPNVKYVDYFGACVAEARSAEKGLGTRTRHRARGP